MFSASGGVNFQQKGSLLPQMGDVRNPCGSAQFTPLLSQHPENCRSGKPHTLIQAFETGLPTTSFQGLSKPPQGGFFLPVCRACQGRVPGRRVATGGRCPGPRGFCRPCALVG